MTPAPTHDTAYWIDQLAIRCLIDRYSDAITRRDWAALPALFAPNAVWEVEGPFTAKFAGRDEIVTNLSQLVGSTSWLIQLPAAIVVHELNGNRASARCTLHEVGHTPDGNSMYSFGVYFDDLVRVEGVWQFSRRSFRFRYLEQPAMPGHVFELQPPAALT